MVGSRPVDESLWHKCGLLDGPSNILLLLLQIVHRMLKGLHKVGEEFDKPRGLFRGFWDLGHFSSGLDER